MKNAETYDFEGVIFPYVTPFQFNRLVKYFKNNPYDYVPPPIVPLQRSVDSTHVLSFKQAVEFTKRSMTMGSIDMWQYLWNRSTEADIFGNTGRPNSTIWKDMTIRTLEDSGIYRCFTNLFFRPEGISGIESKGAAILELQQLYEHVTHYDDDPWVIFGLAKVFPGVSFVLVQTDMSGMLMSRDEKNRFPNVSRIAQLDT